MLTGDKTALTRRLSSQLRVRRGCLWRVGKERPILYSGRDYGLRAKRTWQAVMVAPTGRLVSNPVGEAHAIQTTGIDIESRYAQSYLKQYGYRRLLITIQDIVAIDARVSDYKVQGFSSHADYLAAYERAYPMIKDDSLYKAYEVRFNLKT